jgi:hypothetical protein
LPDFDLILQAKTKANANKIAWISLDSFGRIRAFQWVTANPNTKFLFLGQPVVGGPSLRLFRVLTLSTIAELPVLAKQMIRHRRPRLIGPSGVRARAVALMAAIILDGKRTRRETADRPVPTLSGRSVKTVDIAVGG